GWIRLHLTVETPVDTNVAGSFGSRQAGGTQTGKRTLDGAHRAVDKELLIAPIDLIGFKNLEHGTDCGSGVRVRRIQDDLTWSQTEAPGPRMNLLGDFPAEVTDIGSDDYDARRAIRDGKRHDLHR